MKFKRILAAALTAVLAFSCAACGGTGNEGAGTSNPTSTPGASGSQGSALVTPPSTGAAIEMKIGTTTAVEHPITYAAEEIASLINERSGGRIHAAVYPAEQLGNEGAQVENMQAGLQEALLSSTENFGNYVADFNILGMAFAFKDVDHVRAWFESELGQNAMKAAYDDWGLVCVEYDFERLPRNIVSKIPINSPNDLKGVKFRIPNIPIWEKNWSTLGAVPVVTSFAEVPMALLQGVVDATEGALEDIYSNKLYESAPYVSIVDFAFPLQMMTCSAAFWDSLDADLQQIIKDAAHEAGQHFGQKMRDNWDQWRKEMEDAGTTFIDVDRAPFEEAIKPLVSRLEEEKFWSTPGLYEKTQALVD